jgi:plasmid stabilization system protein ParE
MTAMPGSYRIIISPQASADLAALHAYIARNSPDNAARMVKQLLVAIETLRIFPHRTVFQRASRKIGHPVRTLPVRPYVVYFRAVDDVRVVRVLTIRHGSRQRPGRFNS